MHHALLGKTYRCIWLTRHLQAVDQAGEWPDPTLDWQDLEDVEY